MALRRRSGGRFEANIWPGFVDAMTGLLLIMVFISSVFMIIQFLLRETILGQGRELATLESRIAEISEALGASRNENAALSEELEDSEGRLANLQFEYDAQSAEIADFETRVASLLARNAELDRLFAAEQQRAGALSAELAAREDEIATLAAEIDESEARRAELALRLEERGQSVDELIANLDAEAARNAELALALEEARAKGLEAVSEKEAALLALAQARAEIDSEAENARLAAAKADALEAMIADLQAPEGGNEEALQSSIASVLALAKQADIDQLFAESDEGQALQDELAKLSQLEQERLTEMIAAEYLRERLQNADSELTAMTLSLEEERRKAEETLTLLAAIETERAEIAADTSLSEAEKQEALLALARREIDTQKSANEAAAQRIALLNAQTAELRAQLSALQGLLDQSVAADIEADVRIETLGASLNAALARTAALERARANELESYRSDFFGRLRVLLEDVEGIQIVGDRFVFASEVLFPVGSAELSDAGRAQIGKVAGLILDIADDIPPEINWILRVDGHTDTQPVSATSLYADNWELSQARALSVVRFMIEDYDVAPSRLAATGFGEYHPIAQGNDPESLSKNRRIELKLTEQ